MTRKTKDYILYGVIAFLVLALSFSVFAFVKKSNDLNSANEQINHKQTTIEKQEEENKQLESDLKKSEEDKAKIQSELDTAKQDKEKLQSENSQLKKTITELKAKKAAEEAAKLAKAVSQNPQPTGKVCYLTFDDGPTANTLEILNILKKYNVKATFFVINTPQSNINYVKNIHAEGHAVGLHSNSHNYSYIYKGTDNYFSDLNALSGKLKELIGTEPKIMRFPGGGSNTVSRRYCKGIMSTLAQEVTKKGYTYFDWNVDSGDASGTLSSSKITANVLQGAKGKNSICVLMHDAVGKGTTVQALPKIIEGLINQGFYFAPLDTKSYGYHQKISN